MLFKGRGGSHTNQYDEWMVLLWVITCWRKSRRVNKELVHLVVPKKKEVGNWENKMYAVRMKDEAKRVLSPFPSTNWTLGGKGNTNLEGPWRGYVPHVLLSLDRRAFSSLGNLSKANYLYYSWITASAYHPIEWPLMKYLCIYIIF